MLRPLIAFVCILSVAQVQSVRLSSEHTEHTQASIALSHSQQNIDITDIDDLQRVRGEIVLEGNVSELRTYTNRDGTWWVLRWHDDWFRRASLLVRMWNGEVDMTTNVQWYRGVARFAYPCTVTDDFESDVSFSLEQARYKVENWKQLQPKIVNTKFKLKLHFVSIGRANAGSCYSNAKYTMKRAIKGWYGLYKQRHLQLASYDEENDTYSEADEDEGADVVGVMGANTFNAVLRMWSLVRDLEALYASWQLNSTDADVWEANEKASTNYKEVRRLLSRMQVKEAKGNISRLLRSLKGSLTKHGAERATLRQVRASPMPGVAVRLADGSTVRCRKVYYDGAAAGGFHIEVESKGESGSHVPSALEVESKATNSSHAPRTPRAPRLHRASRAVRAPRALEVESKATNSSHAPRTPRAPRAPRPPRVPRLRRGVPRLRNITLRKWSRATEVLNSAQEFGWRPGSEAIRYGAAFTILSRPKRSTEVPTEGSWWAMTQVADGSVKPEFGLVDPHCEDHPLIGKTFQLQDQRLRGQAYQIMRVDVVNEGKKVVMLEVKTISSLEHSKNLPIASVYSATLLQSLAKNRRLRLDIPGRKKHRVLVFTGVDSKTGFYMTKQVKSFQRFSMGLVDAKTKAHYAVVAERVSALLRIAVGHIWSPPDYVADDRAKKVKFQLDMTFNVLSALIVTGITVSVVGILVTALPVLFSYGLGMTWAIIQPSIWTLLAGQVFGNVINLMPMGIPASLYMGVRNAYLASLLAYDSLNFAEKIGAVSLATELCPLGAGLRVDEFQKFANTTDIHHVQDFAATEDEKEALAAGKHVLNSNRYDMCRRHKLREDDRKEMHAKEQQRKTHQGKKTGMYNPFERDSHWLGWFRPQTLERKAMSRYNTGLYMLEKLTKALSMVSEMDCEVIADPTADQKYTMRNRWILMPRPSESA